MWLVERTRIASRTARRFDAFDHRFDTVVPPVLIDAGFAETQPYVFTRLDRLGQDVVYFDVEGKSFIVQVAYRPQYMNEIDELFAETRPPKAPEIGAPAYLTPTCMTYRPKEYPCQLARRRDQSFDLVVRGLKTHALDWLISLRDPVHYADAVPPTCTMYVARANEVAARLERAWEAYEEMMRRLLGVWEISTFRAFVEFEGAREFVYVCLKLGRESDKCERVMEAIKYRPRVAEFAIRQAQG